MTRRATLAALVVSSVVLLAGAAIVVGALVRGIS